MIPFQCNEIQYKISQYGNLIFDESLGGNRSKTRWRKAWLFTKNEALIGFDSNFLNKFISEIIKFKNVKKIRFFTSGTFIVQFLLFLFTLFLLNIFVNASKDFYINFHEKKSRDFSSHILFLCVIPQGVNFN